MQKKIYCGNLAFNVTEEDIKELFSRFGEVRSITLVTDRYTGKFRGFGFVEMDQQDAEEAIKELNNMEFHGRNLKVNEARERKERGNRPPRRSW